MEDDPNWHETECDTKTGPIPTNHTGMLPHSRYMPRTALELGLKIVYLNVMDLFFFLCEVDIPGVF